MFIWKVVTCLCAFVKDYRTVHLTFEHFLSTGNKIVLLLHKEYYCKNAEIIITQEEIVKSKFNLSHSLCGTCF